MKVQASGSLQGREPSPQQLWTQLSPCATGAGGWVSEYSRVHSRSEQATAEGSNTQSSKDEVSKEGEENQGAEWEEEWSMLTSGDPQALSSQEPGPRSFSVPPLGFFPFPLWGIQE